jgi:hypothetical protein
MLSNGAEGVHRAGAGGAPTPAAASSACLKGSLFGVANREPLPEHPFLDLGAHLTPGRQLLEMGFSEQRARKALVLCRNHTPAAMEWLLEVPDDIAEAPLTETELHRAGLAGPRRSRLVTPRAAAPPSAFPSLTPLPAASLETVVDIALTSLKHRTRPTNWQRLVS